MLITGPFILIVPCIITQDGFHNRGYLQSHPNGTSMFVHRVANAKFELDSADGKPITHVTVPSCVYFSKRGWNSGAIPFDHFQSHIFSVNSWFHEWRKCNFDMRNLYSAVRLCGNYDYKQGGGDDKLPVFAVSPLLAVGNRQLKNRVPPICMTNV